LQVQDVAARIGDIEISLEKIKQMTQSVQDKPQWMNVASSFDEHVRTLVRVQELLEETSERIRELPK